MGSMRLIALAIGYAFGLILSGYLFGKKNDVDIRKQGSGNIDVYKRQNQMYSYVQVPMRLRGQNVNSELFVYRNAKGTKSEQEELTAFLHFQMESLGNVDISVKMKQKNVSANWYLAVSYTHLDVYKRQLPDHRKIWSS